jgi:hypothetical protein
MRCPFCAQECSESAIVCCSCGNDIRVPAALIEENRELKLQVKSLQDEFERLQAQRALRWSRGFFQGLGNRKGE